MTGTFFAALSPKLFAADLLLIDNARPRLMFQRVLREPRLGLAVLIGAVAGTPGVTYVTALHQLVTGNSSTAAQAVAVVDYTLIEFSLVIIPFAFL